MTPNEDSGPGLEKFSDEAILDEAAERLSRMYRKIRGINLCFAELMFVFENGRFIAVDEWSNNIIYRPRPKLTVVKV